MLKPLTALFHPRMVIQALRSRPRDFGDPSACHSRRYNRPGLARTLSQDFDGACFGGWFHRLDALRAAAKYSRSISGSSVMLEA